MIYTFINLMIIQVIMSYHFLVSEHEKNSEVTRKDTNRVQNMVFSCLTEVTGKYEEDIHDILQLIHVKVPLKDFHPLLTKN